MITELLIGFLALALLRKHNASNGIGRIDTKRPKRRIYHEIEAAQTNEIDLSLPYDSADDKKLNELAKKFGFRPSNRSAKSLEEQYFNSLRKAYNAIAGIGKTSLPYRKSTVKNENGDVILIYNDYGTPDQKLRDAYEYIREIPLVGSDAAYWYTLVYIASGGKFLWKDKRKGGVLISRGVEDILKHSERERKMRISYLGSQAKGALTLDQFAHQLWESAHEWDPDDTGKVDDSVIYNGVEEAILQCTSRGWAQQEILNFYYNAHKNDEDYFNFEIIPPSDDNPDMPF